MSAPGRVRARSVCIPLLLGAAIALALMAGRGGFAAADRETFWRLACDALFVPGVLLTGAGLLVVVAAGGAFDALHFGLQKLFGLLRREEKRAQLPRTYFDFVTIKRGKKSPAPAALLSVGLFFLLLSGAALILYFRFI